MYAEWIIAANTWMSIMLFQFINRMGKFSCRFSKIVLLSFLGGIVVVFLPFTIWSSLGILFFQMIILFGKKIALLKKSFFYAFLGAVIAAGFLTFLHQLNSSIFKFVSIDFLFVGIVLLFISYYFVKQWLDLQSKSFIHLMSFQHNGTQSTCRAFIDSGNHAREPISGAPIHFMTKKIATSFLSNELLSYLETLDGKEFPTYDTLLPAYRKLVKAVPLQTVSSQTFWATAIKIPAMTFTENGTPLSTSYVVVVEDGTHFPHQVDLLLHASAILDAPSQQGNTHTSLQSLQGGIG
ncbi:sigma-E processing peptidase SpoIIGA [Paenisporosarcina cavernae]|uniref:Uncharacterized protein n=1 Tax=Paenisporosarcina cavernae TaxID=2320858 RepID=A0A385YU14_9BACL|nr:sigma-E processing peptidase SpoIIGA [Paenisporosarcina cavernae]AYC29168.1 hypothetical protein D3873_04465 [Paenisporosarcina cavernae]